MERQLQKLTEMANDIKYLENILDKKRSRRNKLALELVEEGTYSLRKIAQHAGFENPYLIQLRKKNNHG